MLRVPRMYTINLVNFDNLEKGSFATLEAARDHARSLGFQSAIWLRQPGQEPLYICNINP